MKRTALAAVLLVAGCGNPNPAHVEKPMVGVGPTVARVTPDALPLLDAWATAAGGRPALSAVAAVHGKGTYERGGVSGTIEVWETARGERREAIQQGFLQEIRVFDGKRGWLVDRNGHVRELAGFELDDQLTLSFIGANAALLTDRRPGEVSIDAASGKLVLAPEGGKRPASVVLDPGSHLPTVFERRDGERTMTVTLSDWNAIGGGAKLPWTWRADDGNPNDTATVHWKSLEAATPPAETFTKPMGRTTSEAVLATDPVSVPIEVVFGGLIFVKVSVNDTPMSFIFDTGAEATILNSSRLTKLGLTGLGKFATGAGGGDVVLSYAQGVTTKVGGATVAGQIVGAVLLDDLEGPLGRPIDGILGYDFISRFVVEIDYANQQMRLFDPAKYHHTGAGKPIAMTLEDSTPFLDASVEVPQRGLLPGHFVLDTGCLCDVQLFTPFVDANKLLEALPDAKQTGFSAGAGGETHEITTKVPSLHVGDQIVKDPRADLNRDTTGATADPESAGLIGSLTWKRFVLVLDYPDQQVFLDPLR